MLLVQQIYILFYSSDILLENFYNHLLYNNVLLQFIEHFIYCFNKYLISKSCFWVHHSK